MDKVFCLNCNEPIIGRSDKKFCDAQCRSAYNNQNRNDQELFIRNINKKLRKNRSILKQLNPTGKSTVRREYLIEIGFNFQYITHTFTTQSGISYRFCYEFGYYPVVDNNKDKVVIVNWQEYMHGRA